MVVGHVAGGEDALHGRVGAEVLLPHDVLLGREFELAVEKARVRRVADREEDARRLEHLGAGIYRALQPHTRHALRIVAEHLGQPRVEMDPDLRVVMRPLSHDLRGAEGVAAVHEVDGARKLGEIGRLLHGRVTAAHHDDRLVAEAGQRAVADGTGAHAAVLVFLLARQAEPVGTRARRHDHAGRLDHAPFAREELEGPLREVDLEDVVGDDPRAHVDGLLPHQFHEFRAGDALARMRRHHLPPRGRQG